MMDQQNICTTCGTQYPPNKSVPQLCHICNDDRQYINEDGQSWTSMGSLVKAYHTQINKITTGLYSIKTTPDFALANRAFIVQSAGGNILWDCVPYIDSNAIEFINSIGGLQAIAFSHPHYYSTMNEWATLFDCLIYIHQNDSEWIIYRSEKIKHWSGDSLPLWDDISIKHTGGHFAGSCVLQVPALSPKGVLLSGDSLYISRSKRHIAVMHSYPNQILLSKNEFEAFDRKTKGLNFDTMYGAFDNQNLEGNAMTIFSASMQRYRDSYGI
jgi:glyoxylase-like metal-dependent hydrolase (beta-lactamase superfamily II)